VRTELGIEVGVTGIYGRYDSRGKIDVCRLSDGSFLKGSQTLDPGLVVELALTVAPAGVETNNAQTNRTRRNDCGPRVLLSRHRRAHEVYGCPPGHQD
jgi:hypothetical protein